MTRARFPFAFLALVLFTSAANAQLYRWTDEKGGVHVTDTPPPPNARGVDLQKPRANVVETPPPYELATAMKDFPVVLYTSPSCTEGCEFARKALNSRGVPFREVQVWDEKTNDELKKVTGASQVPTLMVGRSVHQGFQQEAYEALLDSARYPKAGILRPRAQAAPQPPEGYPAEREGRTSRAEPEKPQVEEEAKPAGPYSPGAARQGPRPQKK